MSHELRRFAAEHLSHIAHRKERHHEAEVRLVHLYFGDAAGGCFVDVGANDPKAFSQTWRLEQHGWRGLLIEPLPGLCERLRAERPGSTVVQAACAGPGHAPTADFYVARHHAQSTLAPDALDFATDVKEVLKVPLITLDRAIKEAGLTKLDLVSIDVEGFQMDVLAGFDVARWKPRLILIEDHLTNLKTYRWLTSRGYRLVKRTGLNGWYIPAGEPFTLTDRRERLKLWRKLWLGTPVRALRARLRVWFQRGKRG